MENGAAAEDEGMRKAPSTEMTRHFEARSSPWRRVVVVVIILFLWLSGGGLDDRRQDVVVNRSCKEI